MVQTNVAAQARRPPVDVDVVLLERDPFHLRRCVEALYRHTDSDLFTLILVPHGGDDSTRDALASIAAERSNACSLAAPSGDGALALAQALVASDAPYTVVLRGEALVTPGWLPRLLDAARAEERVGLVLPLVIGASDLPPGYSFSDAAALVADREGSRDPDAAGASGGCWLLTRPARDALLAADGAAETFGDGAALLSRVVALGWRAVVADDCAVYRATAADPSARAATAPPPDLAYDIVIYAPEGPPAPGGLAAVVELVNRLILRGVRATVATTAPVWRPDPWPLFAPLRYVDEHEFLAFAPRACVLVACAAGAAPAVAHLARAYGYRPAQLIQDHEGYLDNGARLAEVAETYGAIPTRIAGSRETRELLSRQQGLASVSVPLGVSAWEFVPRDDAPSAVARLRADGHFLALAILDPADPSGEPYLFEAARQLLARCPEARFLVARRREPWTEEPPAADVPPQVIDLGWLDRATLARTLATVDATVDASLYRGFSRAGIEALSCGTPAVLARGSGAAEFAVDGENCLLVAPRDVAGLVAALLRLREEPGLAGRLGVAGRATALRHDWDALAERWVAVLAPLWESAELDERWLLPYQAHRAAHPVERGPAAPRWWP